MSSAGEIFVLASYMRDIGIAVDRFPHPGETRKGGAGLETHGGKGSNQAIQAARCGATVAIAAAVGDDAPGRAARALWSDEGIDSTSVVTCATQPTGLAVVLIDASGQNQIVIAPGANEFLTPAHLQAAEGVIRHSRLVLSQLETPLAVTRRAFETGRAAGAKTLLNAAPAPDSLPPEVWSLIDILIVNESEAAALTGRSPDSPPAVLGAELLTRVGEMVVLTTGAAGAWLFRRDQAPRHQPALPVTVVDTTGAGDAFIGAFAAEWAGSGDPARALACGVAAGSLACTARGVVPALADHSRIQEALAHDKP